MNKYIVNENGKRLDAYVAGQDKEITRTSAQRLIENGNILVNGKKQKVSYKVSVGDIIIIEDVQAQPVELKVQDIRKRDKGEKASIRKGTQRKY